MLFWKNASRFLISRCYVGGLKILVTLKHYFVQLRVFVPSWLKTLVTPATKFYVTIGDETRH